jgi:type II secretory pathway component PulM
VPAGDSGTILVLVIGYTAIAAALIVVGIDATKVFLARRALAAAADSAALAAAQGVDLRAVYDGPGPRCGTPLPLSAGRAVSFAVTAVNGDRPDLRHTFVTLDAPRVTTVQAAGGSVRVELSGQVDVPFGRVLAWLAPAHGDGLIRVSETATARSPVTDACAASAR